MIGLQVHSLSAGDSLMPAATLLNKLLSEASFQTSSNATGSSTAHINNMIQGNSAVTTESLRMTFLVIITLPIIMVYPFVQKYFVKGVMVGSLKE